MPPPAPTPVQNKPAAAAAAAPRSLTVAKPKPVCPKVVLSAVEGFGKTSTLGHADGAVIIQCRENGYDTLLSSGRVPAIPAPAAADWLDANAWLDHIIGNPASIKLVGVDAMGGLERMCHEYVCKRDFGGDWGDKGFSRFQRGYDVSVSEWLKMLAKLDQINSLGITVVLLSHIRIKPFKNPMGADFDRYVSDVHDKTWAATARWADAVLFGNFLTVVDGEKKGKGKGIGGTDRVLYTERRDAFDAKNRYGMEAVFELPDDPAGSWEAIWSQIVRKDA